VQGIPYRSVLFSYFAGHYIPHIIIQKYKADLPVSVTIVS